MRTNYRLLKAETNFFSSFLFAFSKSFCRHLFFGMLPVPSCIFPYPFLLRLSISEMRKCLAAECWIFKCKISNYRSVKGNGKFLKLTSVVIASWKSIADDCGHWRRAVREVEEERNIQLKRDLFTDILFLLCRSASRPQSARASVQCCIYG